MSYKGPVTHVFLYHAYALALGGWVRDKHGQFTSIPSIAPSVLSITGGYGAACEKNLNISIPGKYPFGERGPNAFHLYVGHAFTEVRGVENEDENPYGVYKTTVRSVLDDVRINDELQVEHAEAILESTHPIPGQDHDVDEAGVVVGDSNMSGVRIRGQKVGLVKHRDIDREPRYRPLHDEIKAHLRGAAASGESDALRASFIEELCDWHNPDDVPKDDKDLAYARDLATINQKSQNRLRFSIFKGLDTPPAKGVKTYKTSVAVEDFGRIFFGEVIASHGMKQVTMFRIDLGCDNCGGV